MSDKSATENPLPPSPAALARVILFTFLVTFVAARVLVFLIMLRRIPDLYVHIGGNHIHHLNYGIFLLAALGGYLLLKRPTGRALTIACIVYGVGLALTFDEFGMWLRLGGAYWQSASLDSIGVLTAFLALLAYAPTLKRFRPRHWWSAIITLLAVVVFFIVLVESFQRARRVIGPRLHELETASPP